MLSLALPSVGPTKQIFSVAAFSVCILRTLITVLTLAVDFPTINTRLFHTNAPITEIPPQRDGTSVKKIKRGMSNYMIPVVAETGLEPVTSRV